MSELKNIFQAVKLPVSGIELPNRIVMAPMTTFSGNQDGTVSAAELQYYSRRSKAAGTIVTACAYVIPHGKGFYGQIGVHSDEMIPGLKALAEAIKANGAKVILQIYHGGRMSPPAEVKDGITLSASNIPAVQSPNNVPRAMTIAEIEETIAAFGAATRRAIEAGFDGVEIHGANTYLLQQFFSPHANRRTDEWGGTLENRMRFPLAVVDEVVKAIAQFAKRPFAVGYRISPEEIENPGITIDDTLSLVDVLASRKLDYLHISTMNFFAPSLRDANDKEPRGLMIHKKVNNRLPVIGVGSVHSADDAQAILNAGVELVALGRELLMEPDWFELAKSNQHNVIRTTLSKKAQTELVIPDTMWNALLSREGWLPVVD